MPVSIGDTGGHRHDWEFALVWTKNGVMTHASFSEHGHVTTRALADISPSRDENGRVKIVYHKDGVKTHAFRFAKENEQAENDRHAWLCPTLVDWKQMKSESVSNEQLRKSLNEADFGEANCPVNDNNFLKEVAKSPPPDYPAADEWKNSEPGK